MLVGEVICSKIAWGILRPILKSYWEIRDGVQKHPLVAYYGFCGVTISAVSFPKLIYGNQGAAITMLVGMNLITLAIISFFISLKLEKKHF